MRLNGCWAYEAQILDASEKRRMQLEVRKSQNIVQLLGTQQAGRRFRLDRLAQSLLRVTAPGTEGSRLESRSTECSGSWETR